MTKEEETDDMIGYPYTNKEINEQHYKDYYDAIEERTAMKTKKVRVEGIDVLTGKKVVEYHQIPDNEYTVTLDHTMKGSIHIGVEYVPDVKKGGRMLAITKFFKHLYEIVFMGYQRSDLPNGRCCLCDTWGGVVYLMFCGSQRFCLSCTRKILGK